MWNCFRNCFLERIGSVLLAAAIFALIAAISAATGGITIAIGGVVILGISGSAIFIALLIFGIVVAAMALACFVGCLGNAQPTDNEGGVVPDVPRREPLVLPVRGDVTRTTDD